MEKCVYPYFVGQLYQVDPGDESGMKEYEMLLDGFDRNPDEGEMMSAVEKIEEAFPGIGGYIASTGKSVILISFDTLIPDIPTDTDADLANLVCSGMEGVHYVKNDDGTVNFAEGLDAFTTGWPSGMGTFWPNITITYPWEPNKSDYYESWIASNENATLRRQWDLLLIPAM